MSGKAIDTAKRLFERDKTLEKVFATMDEQVFPVENHAWNNAKSLDKQKPIVNTILRSDTTEAEAVVTVPGEEEEVDQEAGGEDSGGGNDNDTLPAGTEGDKKKKKKG